MSNSYTVDLTNNLGNIVPYVDEEIEVTICPFCGRAGLNLLEEIGIFSHVISFNCDDTPDNSQWHGPFWSSDLCQEGGIFSISYPAVAIKTRIRHKSEPEWTDEQMDALKNSFEAIAVAPARDMKTDS